MKNKNIFIGRLFYLMFVTFFLIYLFIKTSNGKFVMLPFLICSFAILGKNISLIINKKNYVNLFSKIFIISFLLFWFGFLFYWCYINFINRDYLLFLLSFPFWIIGIYLIKKYLFKEKVNIHNSKIKTNFNFKIIIGSFLVILSLLIGITMLFFGIRGTYMLNKITKNYISTNGHFKEYNIYNSDKDGTTYQLTYIYIVDDIEYTISTDYGTNYIPNKNSIRTVKYNPENPDEAILDGMNSKNWLTFIGAFFTFGSITFILAALSIFGYFDKFKIDIVGTYIGILFLVIGIGIILFQNSTTMSLIETIKSFGLLIIIPIVFVIVGLFQIIKCITKIK